MKVITAILKDEHKNILRLIQALLSECDSLENGKGINVVFFKNAVEFIRCYADGYHHAKEEDILFKTLRNESVKMHCNPIDQMLLEHNLGRGYAKGLEDGIEKNNAVEITKNARAYAELLTDHIYKEDNILYPMIEEALSENQKLKIDDQFSKVENSLSSKKKYLTLLDEIINNRSGHGQMIGL